MMGGVVLREALLEPAEWQDPTDINPNRRAAKIVHGLRVAWQIERLHRDNPSNFTERHVACAHKFVREWETAGNGSSGGRAEKVDGGGSDGIGETQLKAIAADRAARRAIGPSAERVLNIVIVANRPIKALAVALGCNPMHASGRLSAALDRLQEHYDALAEKRKAVTATPEWHAAKEPAPIVPRASLDLPTDIPAEQVGRWRQPPVAR